MKSEELAWKIRRHGIEMTHLSGGSHIGAVLSVADMTVLFSAKVMQVLRFTLRLQKMVFLIQRN